MAVNHGRTILLAASISLTLLACGGGKPMTLDAYFQGLQPVMSDLQRQEAPILATLGDSQNVQELKDALAAYPSVVDDYRNGLKELNPPDEAKEAQSNAVTAANEFYTGLQKAVRDTRNVATVDDFFGAADAIQITVTSQGMTVACNGLQQVADDNEVGVDLNCPVQE